MDLRIVCHELEASEGVQIKLIPIPREIMEKNRTNPPPFLEVAVLEAEPVYRALGVPPSGGKGGPPKGGTPNHAVDIKLTKFPPSLAEVPTKELEVLRWHCNIRRAPHPDDDPLTFTWRCRWILWISRKAVQRQSCIRNVATSKCS